MKRVILLVLASAFLASCSKVALTNRKQLLLVSDAEMLSLSTQSYKQFIDSVPASTDKTQTALVKKVGTNIASAVENYLKSNGLENEVTNFAWEFNLVKDNQVNAFCMPGGKVVFYEGILPMTKNEAGIAVVMGHEIAHAVAKHSSERISQQMLLDYGGALTGVMLSGKSEMTRASIGALYGLGTQVGVALPHSRKQEYEADKLGLMFMAMAGYDPNEAVAFWERMSANNSQSVV